MSRIWVSGVNFLDSGLEHRRCSWIDSEIFLIFVEVEFSSESELEEGDDRGSTGEEYKIDDPGN